MRDARWLVFLTTASIGASNGFIAAAADRAATRPAVFDARGVVTVPVLLDGSGPFMFILDTGTTRTAVADDLATTLGAPIVARAEVVSSAGSEQHDVSRLDRVEVAGARADALLATVIPAARLRAIGTEIRGILGQDFLSAFNYTLDYRRGRLTWDPAGLASCSDRAAVPLVESEGRYVVRVSQERSPRSLRLVPDSGSDSLVLFEALDAHGRNVDANAVALVAVTGNTRARTTAAPGLLVGNITLRSAQAVIVERDATDSDGLLPLHLFGSVSFNMRDGCMIVRAR